MKKLLGKLFGNRISNKEASKVSLEESPEKTNKALLADKHEDFYYPPVRKRMRIFENSEHDALFDENGYVVVPFIGEDLVKKFTALAEQKFPPNGKGLTSTIHFVTPDENYEISKVVAEEMTDLVKARIPDYELIASTFIVKYPGEEGICKFHQDANIIDENSFESLNVWIPLCDVDEHNGCLSILEKSHLYIRNIRSATSPSVFIDFHKNINHLSTSLKMKAGEALFYNHRLLHGSMPNNTDKIRYVVILGLKPKEAPMRYYFKDKNTNKDELEVYAMNLDTFFNHAFFFRNTERPVHLESVSPYKLPYRNLDEDACIEKLSAINRIKGRTFKDPFLEAKLKENGYIVLNVLDEKILHRLKLFYDSLEVKGQPGFYATMFNKDENLKRKIDKTLAGLLSPYLDNLFVDHDMFASNYVVKEPGQFGTMPAHQDWTFVDEKTSMSVNCWIPLQDVDENNGCYYIVEKSHLLPFTLRGTNIPSATRAFKNNFSGYKKVPMKAGEVIIYYHSLIHSTPPNMSSECRISAAVNYKQKDARLIHSYTDSPLNKKVQLFEIDSDFFYKYPYDYTPGVINQMPSGYNKIDEIYYETVTYTEP